MCTGCLDISCAVGNMATEAAIQVYSSRNMYKQNRYKSYLSKLMREKDPPAKQITLKWNTEGSVATVGSEQQGSDQDHCQEEHMLPR